MSKHRAADLSLTVTPLAQRLDELAERSAAQSVTDPRFVAVHDQMAQIADVVRAAMAVMSAQQVQMDARYDALLTRLEQQSLRADEVIATTTARAQAVLEAAVRRLQTSGDALAGYLDGRDVALEAERDRVLRDVLEDFAASLHARERRTLARRLIDVVDRRRDARDAARWRREHGAEQRPAQVLLQAIGADRRRVIDLDAAAQQRRASPRR